MKPFHFGTVSIISFCLSVACVGLFYASSFLLSQYVEGETIAIVQLACMFLSPIFAVIGLASGITHKMRGSKSTLGITLNASMLVVQVVAAIYLMIALATIATID